MKLDTIHFFLGVAMLIVNTFAAPLSEEMQALEERSEMQALDNRKEMQALEERDDMQARGENETQNVERGSGHCQAPWKAVGGFQKCYLFHLWNKPVSYLDATPFCMQPGVTGSRLFTPGSLDEMHQVEKAMIPASVAWPARSYFIGYVEYGWQFDNPYEALVYAANAYPFELMPKGMWGNYQPEDWLPTREPCTFRITDYNGGGIGDRDCVNVGGYKGQTIMCEADWIIPIPSGSKRGDANMMQNGQERGQGNMMQNGQERGQGNMMQNGQERGHAKERQ